MVLGEKIAIIGCGGSGKSTLARELGAITGLPVIHLDQEFWQPGWVKTPKEEWQEKMARIVSGSAWIIDGNYEGTEFETRLETADTVLFLDFSRVVCLYSVIWRWLTHLGRTRPDMAPGCLEKIDLEFLRWIWRFPYNNRPKIVDKLEYYTNGGRTKALALKNRNQVRGLLRELEAGYR